jgi:translation initiation factor IF-3
MLKKLNQFKMKKPINQRAEVLWMLLNYPDMTTKDFVQIGVMNPTSAMSILRQKGVGIVCETKKHKNKFGREIKYGKFNVTNKKEAKNIYNNLNVK